MADVDLDEVEEAILEHSDPVVKANELSDRLGCSSRHVLDLLRLLERAGAVESKEIGARAVAWWHVDRVSEGTANESQPTNERAVSEQPTNHEGTANERTDEGITRERPTNDDRQESSEGIPNESGKIERAVDRAAEHWSGERIEQRKQAARAALDTLREHGAMSKSEILEEVEPRYSVDGQSPRTWWRANLSECEPSPLKELATYSNATKKWEWVG